MGSLRNLPAVERVLEDERIAGRLGFFSRAGVTRLVREAIASRRERLRDGTEAAVDRDALAAAVADEVVWRLERLESNRQRRVINATGVILHTNLGRAVLGEETRRAIDLAGAGYVDLETDLETGERVERCRRVDRLFSLILDVEDAHVVNNNAAAVLLAVRSLAGGGAVAVSRGELVEIGGSFRLPEILAAAAGRVIEVGTTNRTFLRDYRAAVSEGATLLLKVHTSNYRVVGYTNEVSLQELAGLGREAGVATMYDQGSGILYPLAGEGIAGEESLSEVLASGVDLVSFSTDKVLGGPQGGVVAGRGPLVDRMRRDHLARALRVGKLTLAGLERVLLHYWRNETDALPAIGMITADPGRLGERAEELAGRLRSIPGVGVSVREGESSIGGGSFPINPLRTVLVEITLPSGQPARLSRFLRGQDPAIVCRIKDERVLVDLRSVAAHEDGILAQRLAEGIGRTAEEG
ncbi:MAG: L-seryl-tRNA(Sec) selenium transferase [Candidatus Krumholzibacteriota bacterium]|nr:L-seryl-tRNA(Sec) selenium transferase [Candidatus Krumholzibacteriota bacterium]